jgi:putative FmdB family regulatory protein
MPRYDWVCKNTKCKKYNEVLERFAKMDETLTCEECKEELTKIPSTFQFYFASHAQFVDQKNERGKIRNLD